MRGSLCLFLVIFRNNFFPCGMAMDELLQPFRYLLFCAFLSCRYRYSLLLIDTCGVCGGYFFKLKTFYFCPNYRHIGFPSQNCFENKPVFLLLVLTTSFNTSIMIRTGFFKPKNLLNVNVYQPKCGFVRESCYVIASEFDSGLIIPTSRSLIGPFK